MNGLSLRALLVAALLALAGCSSIVPDKPVRATQYDFGAPPAAPAAAAASAGGPLVLDEVVANGAFDSSAILYRLAYADGHQLRPYALARWTATPGQLIRQRLGQHLSRDRPVVDSNAAAALARAGGQTIHVLRIDLEEFSHHFDAPAQSKGVLRLRCTLLENTVGGERLIAQRAFAAEQVAPTPDAPGGVRALAAATDAVAADIAAWLRQPR